MNAQELIIGHVLPIAATVAVLWLVYRLLFRNSNRLKFNRLFLLTSMLLALAMPLLGLLSGMEVPQMATLKQNMFNGMMLSEVIVTPDGQPMLPEVTVTTNTTPSRFSLWQVIVGIYLIGVGVMTLLFLFKLGKLVLLIIRSPKRKMSSCTAVFTGREQGSFSFFRYAFFPNENVDPDIMRHEMSHIAHHHSWDILFAEVMMILQWFNPFIYLYKKELQSLHEYQADRDVVATGVDKKNYMMLILQQCTAVDFSGMSNNFSLILTKKRIKMITRNEKAKGLWWRLLATVPVLAILMIANTKVTAQEQQPEKKQINVEIGQFEIFDDNGFPMDLTDTIIYNEDGSYVHFKTTEAPDPMTGEMRSKITATSCNADGTPNENIKFTINAIEKHGDTTMYTVEPFTLDADNFRLSIQTTEDNPVQIIRNNNDSIYQIVDEMPQYPGGEKAMMEYVAKNVKYPQEAKNKEIQGRVFVSFVIEKDGSVNEVKVLRSIGGGCDEEAVRVIKGMPKWKPGKQDGKPVRVSYMMPINFKLSDGQPSKGLDNTKYEGSSKGTKDGTTYTLNMTMEFESKNSGYFVMTLTGQKNGSTITMFEDVGLPFKYTFDGKSSGAIEPHNPDGSPMNPEPPYIFSINNDGTIKIDFYDFREEFGIKEMVFKKVDANKPVETKKQSSKAKDEKVEMKPDKNGVYQIVEEMPQYPGGEQAMMDFVSKNVVYPKEAQEKGISGRVFVSFIVEKDGSVNEVSVMRGIGGGCDDEAVRVIKAMPKWKPGKMKGKPVRVSYMMPITFKLQ
jgi:TonB family protein